jgi:starch synthase
MPKTLKILFVSSEVDPFAKTGGLADVASALPKTLVELGHDVRVVLPRYGTIDANKFGLKESPDFGTIEIPVNGSHDAVKIYTIDDTTLNNGVAYYFLDNHKYYGRDGLYVDGRTKSDYADNDERFIFFSRGVLEVVNSLGWKPDIIHCNDWQSGLIPTYLKILYNEHPAFRDVKSVFTIHNVAYQGTFPRETTAKAGLPWSVFTPEGLEFYGQTNFLKAGIVYSDAVTTVSETYAEEICSSPEFGYGMEGILRYRKENLFGILNGIDYNVWNPEIDKLIPANYSLKNLKGKLKNKKTLQEKFGLSVDESIPLLGVISRLADQKGFDLLGAIVERLMSFDLQLVILGTGETKYHELFQHLHDAYPLKTGIYLGFNNELAHLIEAGSDMFLMPSRYEPCGLNQMYSLKYGTVPIVRATGGLQDTIDNFDQTTRKGTGFKFGPYDADEFLKTIRRALDLYGNKRLWKTLMTNGMKKDFSWTASAKKYVNLYKTLVKNE